MPNLNKWRLIDFSGNLGHLWGVIPHQLHGECHSNLQDVLKHYFLQTNVVKFAKCML